jgi:hypothetical protein
MVGAYGRGGPLISWRLKERDGKWGKREKEEGVRGSNISFKGTPPMT